MSKDRPKNVAASVRARLTDLARKQKEDLQLALTRYTIERLLYRLTRTTHGREDAVGGEPEGEVRIVVKRQHLAPCWVGFPHHRCTVGLSRWVPSLPVCRATAAAPGMMN